MSSAEKFLNPVQVQEAKFQNFVMNDTKLIYKSHKIINYKILKVRNFIKTFFFVKIFDENSYWKIWKWSSDVIISYCRNIFLTKITFPYVSTVYTFFINFPEKKFRWHFNFWNFFDLFFEEFLKLRFKVNSNWFFELWDDSKSHLLKSLLLTGQ